MGKFSGPLIVTEVNECIKIVHEPFTFTLDTGEVVSIPAGYKTDFASIPRIFWNILPPDGEYAQAAVVHDFIYQNHTFSRKKCDDTLYDAMGALGVASWKKIIIYWNVRWFGELFY